MRTMKSALEQRLGVTIEEGSPVMAWMAEAAGALIHRFAVGADGKTAHERIRGKRTASPMAEFGERVWYKPTMKNRAKLDPRWLEGVWLMQRDVSGENLLGTPNGIVRRAPFGDGL